MPGTSDFYSVLTTLVGSVQNIFPSQNTFSFLLSPSEVSIAQQAGQAAVLGRLAISVFLWPRHHITIGLISGAVQTLMRGQLVSIGLGMGIEWACGWSGYGDSVGMGIEWHGDGVGMGIEWHGDGVGMGMELAWGWSWHGDGVGIGIGNLGYQGRLQAHQGASEPIFLNVYGAQESIPRNEFRQPM